MVQSAVMAEQHVKTIGRSKTEGWGSVLWHWLPLLFWMGVIFLVSGTPTQEIPAFGSWDLLFKKGAHMVAYAVLYLLAHRATGEWRWAFVLTAVYAISDEYHQTFVPGRNGNVVDVMVDWLGAVTALVVRRLWKG